MPFAVKRTKFKDVFLIEPKVFKDKRGFFAEVYKYPDFRRLSIKKHWLQINHVQSQKNTLRGLHYQKRPRAQAKLIQIVSGKIFDVAVDMRKGSPSYGAWVGVTLSSESMAMLYVPAGFAHGYATLSKTAEVIYYASDVYAPELERGIRFDDPRINIHWPIKRPILSDKDSRLPLFNSTDNNFKYGQE